MTKLICGKKETCGEATYVAPPYFRLLPRLGAGRARGFAQMASQVDFGLPALQGQEGRE